MFVDTNLIREKVLKQDSKFVAEHYGLNINTVRAYQAGTRDIGGMRLETVEHIMTVMLEDDIKAAELVNQTIESSRLLFAYGDAEFYQNEDDRNVFLKIEEGKKPRRFRFDPVVTNIIETSVVAYYQLLESAEKDSIRKDLEDIKYMIDLQYFTKNDWEVALDENI